VLIPIIVDMEVQPDGGLDAASVATGRASLWAAPGLISPSLDESKDSTWYDMHSPGGYRIVTDVDAGRVPGSWTAVPAARLGERTFRALLLPTRQGETEPLLARLCTGSSPAARESDVRKPQVYHRTLPNLPPP